MDTNQIKESGLLFSDCSEEPLRNIKSVFVYNDYLGNYDLKVRINLMENAQSHGK
jgi:hypothetical protein